MGSFISREEKSLPNDNAFCWLSGHCKHRRKLGTDYPGHRTLQGSWTLQTKVGILEIVYNYQFVEFCG